MSEATDKGILRIPDGSDHCRQMHSTSAWLKINHNLNVHASSQTEDAKDGSHRPAAGTVGGGFHHHVYLYNRQELY